MKKRFQVFISSTYEDLRLERQAAVEAILKAGHIPAGMELFTAGDESQMKVIRRWIDESDIFMLILGARYGSIEPTTGKSYIELELDYAVETGTPFFAVIMTDEGCESKVRQHGTSVLERKNEAAYRAFRERVSSYLSAFFSTPTEVKLAVFETLPQIVNGRDLVGWVSAADIEAPSDVATELARIVHENSKLRAEIERLRERTTSQDSGFEDLFETLRNTKSAIPADLARAPEDVEVNLLQLALHFGEYLARSVTNSYGVDDVESFVFYRVASPLAAYGLVEHGKSPVTAKWQRLKLSKEGTRFLTKARLRVEQMHAKAAAAEVPEGKATEHPAPDVDDTKPSRAAKKKTAKGKPKRG